MRQHRAVEQFHIVESMCAGHRHRRGVDPQVDVVAGGVAGLDVRPGAECYPHRPGRKGAHLVRHDRPRAVGWRQFAVAGLIHADRVELVIPGAAHLRGIEGQRAECAALWDVFSERISAGGVRIAVEGAAAVSTEVDGDVNEIRQALRHFIRHRGGRSGTGIGHRRDARGRRRQIRVGDQDRHVDGLSAVALQIPGFGLDDGVGIRHAERHRELEDDVGICRRRRQNAGL